MEKLSVWIHCRVSNESDRYLLQYQTNCIKELLDGIPVKIIGISQEVDSGTKSHTRAIDCLRLHIRKRLIDMILVIDKTRLFVHENDYQEFKLFCDMYDVCIVDLQELKQQFQSRMFDCLP